MQQAIDEAIACGAVVVRFVIESNCTTELQSSLRIGVRSDMNSAGKMPLVIFSTRKEQVTSSPEQRGTIQASDQLKQSGLPMFDVYPGAHLMLASVIVRGGGSLKTTCGGAVYVRKSGHLVAQYVEFLGNSAHSGGAICVQAVAQESSDEETHRPLELTAVNFTHNMAFDKYPFNETGDHEGMDVRLGDGTSLQEVNLLALDTAFLGIHTTSPGDSAVTPNNRVRNKLLLKGDVYMKTEASPAPNDRGPAVSCKWGPTDTFPHRGLLCECAAGYTIASATGKALSLEERALAAYSNQVRLPTSHLLHLPS